MTHSTIGPDQMIPASPWVTRYCTHFPARGRVIDLACGRGRHSRWLANLGHQVLAVDRDAEALAALSDVAGVETRKLDLEGASWPLAGEQASGVIVANYLWRPRLPEVLALLQPGGVLIYETFMLGNEVYGKPANPDFLLRPGELRAWVRSAAWCEIAFAEGGVMLPKPAMRQAIVARRPI